VSDSILVPFRTQALTTIEPVDVALIPDCPLDETPNVSYIEATDRLLKRQMILTLKFWMPVFCLGVIGLIVAVFKGVITQDFSLTLGAILFAVTTFISRYLMLMRSDQEPFRQLNERVADSKKHWSDDNAIKRLTGKSLQTAALRQEIETFNADLASLTIADCTSQEIFLIIDKRCDLITRAGKVRQHLLAMPERPNQKLLPEKIAI
jgi:hypothetical protein